MSKKNTKQSLRVIAVITLIGAAALSAFLAVPLTAIGDPPPGPPVISDDQMQTRSMTIGGAQVLQTTRTVPHWSGSTLDPSTGVTYGYNMVGANPNTCSGTDCDVTVTVDIIPLNVTVADEAFNGTEVVAATVASPVFALNDYGSTPFASADNFPNSPRFIKGPGGVLSQNDAGNQLQFADATMRSHFNQTGSSPYHLRLNPVLHDAINIDIPSGQGAAVQNARGVHAARVKYDWWRGRLQNLQASLGYVDPTHLSLYLTKDLQLYCGNDPLAVCAGGFHGAGNDAGEGSQNGNGNQPVSTFAWASYASPGLNATWAQQDIYGVSHEVAEWVNNPFVTNTTPPWGFPTQGNACVSNLLETGDAPVNIGFAMGTNVSFQGPNPNGTQTADGYYHPTDLLFVPWLMHVAPNNISESTQSPSANIGRYTLMGDLNPLAAFHQPSTCN